MYTDGFGAKYGYLLNFSWFLSCFTVLLDDIKIRFISVYKKEITFKYRRTDHCSYDKVESSYRGSRL